MTLCASCRAGGNRIDADYRVTGRINRSGRRMPYNAYLCDDHLEMMLGDGDDLRITEYVSPAAQDQRALELITAHTYYTSIPEFLHNNPTLRGFDGANFLANYHRTHTPPTL